MTPLFIKLSENATWADVKKLNLFIFLPYRSVECVERKLIRCEQGPNGHLFRSRDNPDNRFSLSSLYWWTVLYCSDLLNTRGHWQETVRIVSNQNKTAPSQPSPDTENLSEYNQFYCPSIFSGFGTTFQIQNTILKSTVQEILRKTNFRTSINEFIFLLLLYGWVVK